jgi:hypothetical protein
LATRAVYSFTGFPHQPVRHLYLHHDGYPTGAAWRLATSLRHDPSPIHFLTSFLSTQPGVVILATAEQAADAEYRYLVQRLPGSDPALLVQCWRRIPGLNSWNLRCGPLPLAAFIERFLPGDQLPQHHLFAEHDPR